MSYEVTLSKINSIVGTDDLLPDKDEKKKLEKLAWLRKQVDFKVMVKIEKDEEWEDFTGLFLMKDCWDASKVIEHVRQYFSTDQFKMYTFGLFKRYYKNTTANINHNFRFDFEGNIELLENPLLIDKEGTINVRGR